MAASAVRVVPVTRLGEVRGFDGGVVVVDATESSIPLSLLARAVRLRRVLRLSGGELVLVGGGATADLLRRSGLHRSLPHYADLASALRAVRRVPHLVAP